MSERSLGCSVWLGAETGLLKGVNVSRRQAFNFSPGGGLSRGSEVRALCWGDSGETELLLGAVDGCVRTFSIEKGRFTEQRNCGGGAPGEGYFSGLGRCGPSLITCTESGLLQLWREEEGEEAALQLQAGGQVSRMRLSPLQDLTVATGGKENGLKIWDLTRPEAPVFTAKNLRDDWLALRRPYWVKDMAFIPDTAKVVTCTGYHQVHIYDPSTPQRRPVLEADFGEFPLTALSLPASGHSVVVGNTQGQLAILDLRKGLVRGALKGAVGAVRGLQCHPSLPLVASCGLDRFLRIHSLEGRSLLHKVYLKSRLNCVLLSSRDLEGGAGDVGEAEVKEEEQEQDDEVWDNMEQVQEEKKRKAEEPEQKQIKKKKKKKKGQD